MHPVRNWKQLDGGCSDLARTPQVKQIPHYRKTVIAMLPELKYLDDRPVFVEDRRTASCSDLETA